jgi:hypothetical protein
LSDPRRVRNAASASDSPNIAEAQGIFEDLSNIARAGEMTYLPRRQAGQNATQKGTVLQIPIVEKKT